MSYQDKPIATIREALRTLLTNNVGAGVGVFDYMPSFGARPPCVVLQNIAGSASETAIGEFVESAKKGLNVTAVFQFDIYHSDFKKCEEVADKVLNLLWTSRAQLKSQNKIEFLPPRGFRDLPAGEAGERLYRKSGDIPFMITMTAAA